MVLLGHGTTEGWAGYKETNHLIRATGYMMVTDGAAWCDAKEQMYLVSREDDVIVRAGKGAKKVLVQSDDGSVWVGGGNGVLIGAKNEVKIYADTAFKKSDVDYKTEITEDLEKKYEKGWTEKATRDLDWGQTIAGILAGIVGVAHERKVALKEKKGWKVKSLTEFAEIVIESVKLVASIRKGTQANESPGSVSVHAEHEVGVLAGGVLELFGKMGAGMSSPVSVDLIGGTVGAKAATFASVWGGLSASLVSAKEATVSAAYETRIKSPKEVNITGGEEVKIGAGKVAVMSAEKEYAVVFGKEFVYVAAEGYGMKAKEGELALGKMTSPSEYSSAAPAKWPILKMDDKTVLLKCNSCKVEMTESNSHMELYAQTMKISSMSGYIEAGNGKILLDF
jgi:hypothetical protein